MNQQLHSSSWYRIADMRPKLRPHVRVNRQMFRGQIWYVFQDVSTGQYHRISPAANFIIGLMNGERTVQEIWDIGCAQLEDEVLTQDEILRLLAQLHQSNMLSTDVAPDIDRVSHRIRKQRRRKLLLSMINPMAVRLPLFDPDAFLDATYPLVRPFLSWFGVLIFLGVTAYGAALAGMHWGQLTSNIADRMLATESLLLLFGTYPFVKALHELGHAYVVKRWGGEVHELGIMFLVFMPVPYVDASAASAFREKWRRALVGAAGILVELFLAALAMIVWVETTNEFIHALAFNVMVIGGVSSLLFNGNPLLRFDGYYVFSDIIEIPNLGNRSNRYVQYLIQRYLFGARDARSPVTAPGERFWFFTYSISAFCYRVTVVIAIVLFVASKFFVVGVAIAIWGVVMMVGLPLAKSLSFLLNSPVLRNRRGRAIGIVSGTVAIVCFVVLALPLPYTTISQGVVWVPGGDLIIAGTEGEVAKLMMPPNRPVRRGDALIRLRDPVLDAQVEILRARVQGLRLKLVEASVRDPSGAKVTREELKHASADYGRLRERQDKLVVHSPADGEFILRRPGEIVGSFVKKGDLLAYVIRRGNPTIRAVVPEFSADLVRSRTTGIEVRFADAIDRIYPAAVARELPRITDRLPSPALSTAGGGDVVVDASDPHRLRTVERVMDVEIRLAAPVPVSTLGGRVYVRFNHGYEPLGSRFYRSVRQTFLKRFNV